MVSGQHPALWIASKSTNANENTFDICNRILAEPFSVDSVENILNLYEETRYTGTEELVNITNTAYNKLVGCSEVYSNTEQGVNITKELVSFSQQYGTEKMIEDSLEYAIDKLYKASEELGKTYLAVQAACDRVDYAKHIGDEKTAENAMDHALYKSIEVSNSLGDTFHGTYAAIKGVDIAELSPVPGHINEMAKHLAHKVQSNDALEYNPSKGMIKSATTNQIIYMGERSSINKSLSKELNFQVTM